MNAAVAQAIELLGTQAKLAEQTGLSQQHISRLLRGKQPISAKAAIKIEAATGYRVPRGQLCPEFWPPASVAAQSERSSAR